MDASLLLPGNFSRKGRRKNAHISGADHEFNAVSGYSLRKILVEVLPALKVLSGLRAPLGTPARRARSKARASFLVSGDDY